MKTICSLVLSLMFGGFAQAEPVDIDLENGGKITAAEVVELNAKGIRVKSSRGAKTLAFADITSESAVRLGALDPSKEPEGSIIARQTREPLERGKDEKPADFKKRLANVSRSASILARSAWAAAEAGRDAERNRAVAFMFEMRAVKSEAAAKAAK